MMVIKSKKAQIEKEIYTNIVESYLTYLKSDDYLRTTLSAYEVSELLRYSLCDYFNLESKGASIKIENLSECIKQVFRGIQNMDNLLNKSEDYRKGVLEACIHCLEMSRQKAGV